MSKNAPFLFMLDTEIKKLKYFEETYPFPEIYYDIKINGDDIYFYIQKTEKVIQKTEKKSNLLNYYIKNPNLVISSNGKICLMKTILPTFRKITQSEFDKYCINRATDNYKIWKSFCL